MNNKYLVYRITELSKDSWNKELAAEYKQALVDSRLIKVEQEERNKTLTKLYSHLNKIFPNNNYISGKLENGHKEKVYVNDILSKLTEHARQNELKDTFLHAVSNRPLARYLAENHFDFLVEKIEASKHPYDASENYSPEADLKYWPGVKNAIVKITADPKLLTQAKQKERFKTFENKILELARKYIPAEYYSGSDTLCKKFSWAVIKNNLKKAENKSNYKIIDGLLDFNRNNITEFADDREKTKALENLSQIEEQLSEIKEEQSYAIIDGLSKQGHYYDIEKILDLCAKNNSGSNSSQLYKKVNNSIEEIQRINRRQIAKNPHSPIKFVEPSKLPNQVVQEQEEAKLTPAGEKFVEKYREFKNKIKSLAEEAMKNVATDPLVNLSLYGMISPKSL